MSNADLESVFDIARRVVADMEREVELAEPDQILIQPVRVTRWANKLKALVIPADCPEDCGDENPCPRCVAAGTAICAECGEEATEVYCFGCRRKGTP
ncbi:MAG: hypothetical protein GY838_13125 [bacterium]|nr:hypothetical protein [bacterium]